MLKPHYGTALVSREEVKPGTAILYNGRYYMASANVRIPLYSITDWHRSPISDSHPFDQPGT